MNDVIEQRISRINHILDRLDKIPGEIDRINEKLFNGNITREDFARMVDKRSSLIIEQERLEKELKTEYKIIS